MNTVRVSASGDWKQQQNAHIERKYGVFVGTLYKQMRNLQTQSFEGTSLAVAGQSMPFKRFLSAVKQVPCPPSAVSVGKEMEIDIGQVKDIVVRRGSHNALQAETKTEGVDVKPASSMWYRRDVVNSAPTPLMLNVKQFSFAYGTLHVVYNDNTERWVKPMDATYVDPQYAIDITRFKPGESVGDVHATLCLKAFHYFENKKPFENDTAAPTPLMLNVKEFSFTNAALHVVYNDNTERWVKPMDAKRFVDHQYAIDITRFRPGDSVGDVHATLCLKAFHYFENKKPFGSDTVFHVQRKWENTQADLPHDTSASNAWEEGGKCYMNVPSSTPSGQCPINLAFLPSINPNISIVSVMQANFIFDVVTSSGIARTVVCVGGDQLVLQPLAAPFQTMKSSSNMRAARVFELNAEHEPDTNRCATLHPHDVVQFRGPRVTRLADGFYQSAHACKTNKWKVPIAMRTKYMNNAPTFTQADVSKRVSIHGDELNVHVNGAPISRLPRPTKPDDAFSKFSGRIVEVENHVGGKVLVQSSRDGGLSNFPNPPYDISTTSAPYVFDPAALRNKQVRLLDLYRKTSRILLPAGSKRGVWNVSVGFVKRAADGSFQPSSTIEARVIPQSDATHPPFYLRLENPATNALEFFCNLQFHPDDAVCAYVRANDCPTDLTAGGLRELPDANTTDTPYPWSLQCKKRNADAVQSASKPTRDDYTEAMAYGHRHEEDALLTLQQYLHTCMFGCYYVLKNPHYSFYKSNNEEKATPDGFVFALNVVMLWRNDEKDFVLGNQFGEAISSLDTPHFQPCDSDNVDGDHDIPQFLFHSGVYVYQYQRDANHGKCPQLKPGDCIKIVGDARSPAVCMLRTNIVAVVEAKSHANGRSLRSVPPVYVRQVRKQLECTGMHQSFLVSWSARHTSIFAYCSKTEPAPSSPECCHSENASTIHPYCKHVQLLGTKWTVEPKNSDTTASTGVGGDGGVGRGNRSVDDCGEELAAEVVKVLNKSVSRGVTVTLPRPFRIPNLQANQEVHSSKYKFTAIMDSKASLQNPIATVRSMIRTRPHRGAEDDNFFSQIERLGPISITVTGNSLRWSNANYFTVTRKLNCIPHYTANDRDTFVSAESGNPSRFVTRVEECTHAGCVVEFDIGSPIQNFDAQNNRKMFQTWIPKVTLSFENRAGMHSNVVLYNPERNNLDSVCFIIHDNKKYDSLEAFFDANGASIHDLVWNNVNVSDLFARNNGPGLVFDTPVPNPIESSLLTPKEVSTKGGEGGQIAMDGGDVSRAHGLDNQWLKLKITDHDECYTILTNPDGRIENHMLNIKSVLAAPYYSTAGAWRNWWVELMILLALRPDNRRVALSMDPKIATKHCHDAAVDAVTMFAEIAADADENVRAITSSCNPDGTHWREIAGASENARLENVGPLRRVLEEKWAQTGEASTLLTLDSPPPYDGVFDPDFVIELSYSAKNPPTKKCFQPMCTYDVLTTDYNMLRQLFRGKKYPHFENKSLQHRLLSQLRILSIPVTSVIY